MGQAKSRGTFEQRKATAIARDKIDAENREKLRREIEAARTPEERKRECKTAIRLCTIVGLADINPYIRTYKTRH